jgi:hypothetical protein
VNAGGNDDSFIGDCGQAKTLARAAWMLLKAMWEHRGELWAGR